MYDWRVQVRADRALRLAGVGIIVSLALGALYRAFLCLFNAFVFGPLLGGLTYPLVAVLPGTADATLLPVLFAEAVGGIAVAVWAGSMAVRLIVGRAVNPARWRAAVLTMLVLGTTYPVSMLIAMPRSGMGYTYHDQVGLAVLSLLDLLPVIYAWRALRYLS